MRFHYEDTVETQERVLALLRTLEPKAFPGFSKVRIGRANDGGYVMLDDFEGIQGAYSLGIKDDVSWDLDIAARGIDVFQYDHTIDAAPAVHPRLHWSKIGIEGTKSGQENLDTLENLLAQNGHSQATDLLLKCDIEGSEWEMLANLGTTNMKRFRQVTVEMHAFEELRQQHWYELLRRAFSVLTAHHSVVHVHGNNCAPMCVVGGVALPMAIEFTFMRRDNHTIEPSKELFPIDIDQRCCVSKAEHILGSFRF
ncbi:hypothetical protein [Methylobacterium trifolii]|uniref:Methyltransferase FkbM domain-containing protein n=1 Tax=Methylobacterium trifolii TaxID=1003092 RepID=A0ABQ4U041_9HYPH|nr:hypothetical protein [Methylobacterium trifolii]GJE60512.1 hypothetical protein MPOCJGCO_2624 [Methylobacterium trifolii]